MDPLKPSASLLVKLGSIIVHYEESKSDEGHHLDLSAIDGLMQDPEVVEWFEAMNGMALLPLKRGGR